jgi:Surface-adhesin protein E
MRLIVALLLMTLTAAAWAEWVKYGESKDGFSFYYDPTAVKKHGQFRRVRILIDYSKSIAGALSHITLFDYDCREVRGRAVLFTAYSGRMATGTVAFDPPPLLSPLAKDTWSSINRKDRDDPRTMLLSTVCERKKQWWEFWK